MRRLMICFLLLAIAMGTAPAHAQSALTVTDATVDYLFGDFISFSARVDPTLPVSSVSIIFRALSETQARVETATYAADGTVSYRFDIPANVLPPFATITYHYQVTLTDGQKLDSPEFTFRYEDNRFAWSMLDGGVLRVFWYEGDTAFGQSALDTARKGLTQSNALFQLTPNAVIDIFIYASAIDLQGALGPGSPMWAAGHSSPELGVVMVSIPPGQEQSQEMERQIPHELAHILLYQNLGKAAYDRLPDWLREGMPSMAEVYRNPDYPFALRLAVQNSTLIPMIDLCNPFPQDASRAFLSYAQSESFTRYLFENYGASGLFALMSAYADGLSCAQGAERALGKSLIDLENDWRTSVLGENQLLPAVRGAIPYIALPLLLIVPVLLILALGVFDKRN